MCTMIVWWSCVMKCRCRGEGLGLATAYVLLVRTGPRTGIWMTQTLEAFSTQSGRFRAHDNTIRLQVKFVTLKSIIQQLSTLFR